MENTIYGSDIFDNFVPKSEDEIVTALEACVNNQVPDFDPIPALNDLLQYRKFLVADNREIESFKNSAIARYERDRNEDVLWEIFEKVAAVL